MAKVFNVNVQRILYGTIHILAESEEEALAIARDYSDNDDIKNDVVTQDDADMYYESWVVPASDDQACPAETEYYDPCDCINYDECEDD